MRLRNDTLHLSASDLASYLGCRRLSHLSTEVAYGRATRPTWHDPTLEALELRGFQHENAYVDHLEQASAAGPLTVHRVAAGEGEGISAARAGSTRSRWSTC